MPIYRATLEVNHCHLQKKHVLGICVLKNKILLIQ